MEQGYSAGWCGKCQAGNKGGPVSGVKGFLWSIPAHQLTTGLAEPLVHAFTWGAYRYHFLWHAQTIVPV